MKQADTSTKSVLANAVDLGANVIKNVLGNDASDSVGGVLITERLRSTVAGKLDTRLANKRGGN